MPRCSVNGACNLVRVRAIRFPPLRHWPRCGCSAQALAGFITAGLLPPLQFVVGSKMVNAGLHLSLLAVRVCATLKSSLTAGALRKGGAWSTGERLLLPQGVERVLRPMTLSA